MKPSSLRISLFMLCIAFLSGEDIFAQKFKNGIKVDYYNGINFDYFVVSKIEKKIGFWREMKSPAKGVGEEYFSIRYSGSIKAPTTGVYIFHVIADDGIRVRINHRLIIDAWIDQEATPYSGLIFFEKDELYDIEIEYYNTVVHSIFNVKWEVPAKSYQLFDLKHEPKIVEIPWNVLVPERSNPNDQKGSLIGLAISKDETQLSPKTPLVSPTPVKRNLRISIASKSVPVNEPIVLKTVVFDQQSSTLKSDAAGELDQVVKYLARNLKAKIQISGYTDYLGDSLDNQILSEQRAKVIATYLIKAGIEEKRISSTGFGSRFPLVVSDNLQERNANRRVEFKIVE